MSRTASIDLIRDLIQRGIEQHRRGDTAQALALYEQALALDANHANALCLAGIAEFQAGNRDRGLSLARRATDVQPGFVAGHTHLARMLEAAGHHDEALATYGKAFHTAGLTHSDQPPESVLAELVITISRRNPEHWHSSAGQFTGFGQLVARTSHEAGPPSGIIETLGNTFNPAAGDASTAWLRAFGLLQLLGFAKASPPAWTKTVFQQLALPWMMEALASRRYELALRLEALIHEAYVKQTETGDHFRESFAQWVGPMRAAGQAAAINLPAAHWPGDTPKPVVGFFIHQASVLAHVEVMLSVLEHLPAGDARPFHPRVYVFNGTHPELLDRLARHDIPVILMGQEPAASDSWFRRLVSLRQRLSGDGVTALVWVCLAVMMPFAFALRLAPVQIWWSVKYHGLESPDIDGYITGALGRHKNIDGRLWRTANLGKTDWYDPSLSMRALEIRKQYAGFELVLGTFGREEILASQPYLEAVAEILRSNPKAAFLWTGRHRLDSIQSVFDRLGVDRQCFFIGWVDTRLYAQVIDIFLDSFPFPCGFTAFQAMAAGKPIVLYASPESYETGVRAAIAPVLENPEDNSELVAGLQEIFAPDSTASLYLCAESPQQYVQHAVRLMSSPEFRVRVGAAGRTFIARYYSDPEQSAKDFSAHVLETIEETREAGYGDEGVPDGTGSGFPA